MALFIAKPILWNQIGYQKPPGVKPNSGFAGYEAPLQYTVDDVDRRVQRLMTASSRISL